MTEEIPRHLVICAGTPGDIRPFMRIALALQAMVALRSTNSRCTCNTAPVRSSADQPNRQFKTRRKNHELVERTRPLDRQRRFGTSCIAFRLHVHQALIAGTTKRTDLLQQLQIRVVAHHAFMHQRTQLVDLTSWAQLISATAAEIKRQHELVHETARHRNNSPQARTAWQTAWAECRPCSFRSGKTEQRDV